jgi:hypothetical protein
MKRNTRNTRKTRKQVVPIKSQEIQEGQEKTIVCRFLEILHSIKLFHWRTTSYAIHKATCELHSNLSGNIDSFVEIMIGKNGVRIDMSSSKTMDLCSCATPEQFKERVEEFRSVLIAMNSWMDASTNSDLLNIRDEMVGHVNQFLYLLTLS